MTTPLLRPVRTVALTAALGAAIGVVSVPAAGQTLGERIEALRQKRAEAEAEAEAKKRELPPETKILQQLFYTKMTLGFRGTPAREVIDYFRTVLGVNVVGRYLDDRAVFGIDPEQPVTLEVENVRALDALELVLEAMSAPGDECTWQIRKGVLEVGTKERLGDRAAAVVRVYSIDDLLYVPEQHDDAFSLDLRQYYEGQPYGGGYFGDRYVPGRYAPHRFYSGRGGGGAASGSFGGPRVARDTQPNSAEQKNARAEEIIELIVSTIEPAGWVRNGGEWASIEHREGVLVVRAPDFVQRQIGGYGPVPKPEPTVAPRGDGSPGEAPADP